MNFFSVGLAYELSGRFGAQASVTGAPTSFWRHAPMLTLALSLGSEAEQRPRRDPTLLEPPLEVDAPRLPAFIPTL